MKQRIEQLADLMTFRLVFSPGLAETLVFATEQQAGWFMARLKSNLDRIGRLVT